jgi:hypothetical protein
MESSVNPIKKIIDRTRLKNAFIHNRAEELPDDVWGTFVIPKHYHSNDLSHATKARVIVGGRGCGKTMFIRYFCHPTRFSINRESIDLSELKHIGLYWRPHTQFCSLFSKSWLGDNYRAAFLHYFSLILTIEFINSMKSIARSACTVFDESVLTEPAPNYFLNTLPLQQGATLQDLLDYCLDDLDLLETWVNRPTSDLKYNLIPTISVQSLIRGLIRNYPAFNETMFQIFVDEFENLQDEQQRLINDFIKHGRRPIIFSIAMKKFAKITTQTSGEEHINKDQDFVQIDLEASYKEDDFDVLAAEITLLRLYDADIIELPKDVDKGYFTDPDRLESKGSKEVSQKILNAVSQMFPKPSIMAISEEIIRDSILKGVVSSNLRKGLDLHKERNLSVENFFKKDPRIAIVSACVVNRKTMNPSEVLNHAERFERGESNSFEGDSGWIKSTLNGAILLTYNKFQKRCPPLYSGFSRLCRMSKKNIRHYQQLLKQCIIELPDEDLTELIFSPEIQARSAVEASNSLLAEVVRFGSCGEQLLGFVKRLGFLYELSQKRISQSECEVNHFSLNESDESRLSENAKFVIREAKRWSVIFEESDATKSKNASEVATSDYVLNPIYAPKFGISIRKNRKITLTTPDVEALIQGNTDSWKGMVNRYINKWENDQLQEDLFSHEI